MSNNQVLSDYSVSRLLGLTMVFCMVSTNKGVPLGGISQASYKNLCDSFYYEEIGYLKRCLLSLGALTLSKLVWLLRTPLASIKS